MKLASVILSLIIFIQSMNFGLSDILRLNEMIEHAELHNKKYGDDFFTFLSKHYGDQKEKHHEHHQEEAPAHERLPFNQKHFHSVDCQSFILTRSSYGIEKLEFFEEQNNSFFYLNIYSSTFKNGIFQPPRLA